MGSLAGIGAGLAAIGAGIGESGDQPLKQWRVNPSSQTKFKQLCLSQQPL